ncbi:DUF2809 domain-containing protein [Leeuwenhoekiella parthenopeia]|uniref:DUF2809 domain-containing protein n=1 Tax=Leeuwenhoekiella parthenopeia TaxID=2890320 RepID=A0ABS8GV85_9FLAO|nr:DUF2809 domain-containing protein [Leeuwenhoekiella parthenopeia]MCC4213904.1 DUF2809 domain-containing protein [Leeuwenhoekiella parthenopeia]
MIPRAKRLYYVIGFVILFGIEAAIAMYLKGGFIRSYLGDLLAVILIYTLIMSCSRLAVKTGLVLTASIALLVEVLQLIDLTQFFEGTYKQVATLVFGSHFSWIDLLMYALGMLAVYRLERVKG